MFTDLIQYPIEHPRLVWEAKQVLRDIDGVPHIFLRIKLSGTIFRLRALPAQVAVGGQKSQFIELSEDRQVLRAYFDRPVPLGYKVLFGYGNEHVLRFPIPITEDHILKLDKNRLPEGTKNLERFF